MFNDGYLGLPIDGSSPAVAIPIIALNSICLIIQLAIGLMACRQMMNNKNVQTPFKVSFGASLVFACTATITFIVGSPIFSISWTITTGLVFSCLSWFSALSFYSSLLAILVMRLRFVFKEMMQMSERTYFGFKCLFIALFAIPLLACALVGMEAAQGTNVSIADNLTGKVLLLLYSLGFLFLFLYLIGVVCASSFLLNNLRKLALSQLTTPRNMEAQKTDDIPLKDQQGIIVNLASRYSLLFIVALSSDLLTYVLMMAMSFYTRSIFQAMDFTINVFCIYFQFAFTGKQYMRCCGCIHRPWRKRMDNIAKRAIRSHSVQMSGSYSFPASTPSTI